MADQTRRWIAEGGGAQEIRRVLEEFYERVFADLMIGFLFRGKDRHRLVEKELELTLEALGADVPYTGRPLRAVHAPLPILGGHFLRRLQILREVMAEHGLPRPVQEAWIRHSEALRDQVTADRGSDCRDPLDPALRPPRPQEDRPSDRRS